MVADGVVVLLMIKLLKAVYPDVTKPWYVEDDGALGTFDTIGLYFNSLKHFGLDQHFGPGREYYPKPPKMVLIVHPYNLVEGK